MERYLDPALAPRERALDLLSKMTLEEKLAQADIIRGVEFFFAGEKSGTCTVEEDDTLNEEKLEKTLGNRGIGYIHDIYSVPAIKNTIQKWVITHSRLGIPCIFTAEALHGLCWAYASVFPVPLTLSQSFDPDLVREIGARIAAECRSTGHHEILAPNLDVARDPRWGRTEETFGEDTYLSSEYAAAIVSGEQRGDISRPDAVICEPKHYCVHGIAEGGLNCAPARVGQREVETAYLPVFEAAVRRGGAYNVMACYNSIDSEPVITSEHYLKKVFKERFGARGITRADWGGVKRLVHSHKLTRSPEAAVALAVNGGLDMQGCCDYTSVEWESILLKLIKEGKVSEARIDDAVLRILTMKFKLGLFEHPYCDETHYKDVLRCDEHKALSLRAAREGMVLLKNDDSLLPMHGTGKIAVIGPSSAAQKLGGYTPAIRGYKPESVYEALKRLCPDADIRQCDGCAITRSNGQNVRYVDGQPHLTQLLDKDIDDMLDEAAALAADCDIAVLVCGDNNVTSGEGFDRCRLTLYGKQRELISRVAATGTPVVLVLENGKALDLSEESRVCKSILIAGFGGECGAQAIVETLLGQNVPAGRLSVSYPRDEGMLPCYYSRLPGGSDRYIEDAAGNLYPFGHGLSYTTFSYADLSVTPLGGYRFSVSFSVKNTGNTDADEVAQLYINDIESSIVVPDKLLRKFARISLRAGETKTVSFELGFDDLKLLNGSWEWVVEPGDFAVMVGASSADIRLNGTLTVR